MSSCFIFSACEGEPKKEFTPQVGDLIIAADAGFLKLKELGITPDLVVGDFDSLNETPENTEIIKHPTKKDDTDTLLAVKIGLERGFSRFHLYGGSGGRIDHTLANFAALSFIAKNGGQGYLYGENFVATALTKDELEFSAEKRGNISVFSAESECIVSIEGLLYPLNKAKITFDFPIGVSNEFIGREAKITVHKGTAIIIFER